MNKLRVLDAPGKHSCGLRRFMHLRFCQRWSNACQDPGLSVLSKTCPHENDRSVRTAVNAKPEGQQFPSLCTIELSHVVKESSAV